MKVAAIKKLVEHYSLEQCRKAEESLMNGVVPEIEIEGTDEGEQLTHILGAIDILEHVARDGKDIHTATRDFIERVRNSIN